MLLVVVVVVEIIYDDDKIIIIIIIINIIYYLSFFFFFSPSHPNRPYFNAVQGRFVIEPPSLTNDEKSHRYVIAPITNIRPRSPNQTFALYFRKGGFQHDKHIRRGGVWAHNQGHWSGSGSRLIKRFTTAKYPLVGSSSCKRRVRSCANVYCNATPSGTIAVLTTSC